MLRDAIRILLMLALLAASDQISVTPCRAEAPLANLPSAPGDHVAKIEALADNAWLNLGAPAADPNWGRARGRSWSSNMSAAPELRGGFVFGEGVHGYTKPDGHYMNDLWFYDIQGHRWICLYPGIEVMTIAEKTKTKELKVDEHGLLVDKMGEPLPPLLIHAYGYLGYEPEQRKFAFFGSQFGNYFTTGKGGVFEEANQLFQEQRAGKKYAAISPFFYDISSGKFSCYPVENAPQGQPYGANVLVYVNSRKQFFYGGSDGVWFFDASMRKWLNAEPKGNAPEGIDHCAAYDSKRDCIYYYCRDAKTANENFFVFDVAGNMWKRPVPTGTGPISCSSYESIFSFDTVNDALVVIRLYEDKDEPGLRRGIYSYSPATNSWADPLLIPEAAQKSIRNGNFGFFDPGLNAHFCHFASDSTDDGVMWAYRYKKPHP
jgi:hypothetical protein